MAIFKNPETGKFENIPVKSYAEAREFFRKRKKTDTTDIEETAGVDEYVSPPMPTTGTGTGTGAETIPEYETSPAQLEPSQATSIPRETGYGTGISRETGYGTGVKGQLPVKDSQLPIPRSLLLNLGLAAVSTPLAAGLRGVSVSAASKLGIPLAKYFPRATQAVRGAAQTAGKYINKIPYIGEMLPNITEKQGQVRALAAAIPPTVRVVTGESSPSTAGIDVLTSSIGAPSGGWGNFAKEMAATVSAGSLGALVAGEDVKGRALEETIGTTLGRGIGSVFSKDKDIFEGGAVEAGVSAKRITESPEEYIKRVGKMLPDKSREDFIEMEELDTRALRQGIDDLSNREAIKKQAVDRILVDYPELDRKQAEEFYEENLDTRYTEKAEDILAQERGQGNYTKTDVALKEQDIREEGERGSFFGLETGKKAMFPVPEDISLKEFEGKSPEEILEGSKKYIEEVDEEIKNIMEPSRNILKEVGKRPFNGSLAKANLGKAELEAFKNLLTMAGLSGTEVISFIDSKNKYAKKLSFIDWYELKKRVEDPSNKFSKMVKERFPVRGQEILNKVNNYIEGIFDNAGKEDESLKNFLKTELKAKERYTKLLKDKGRTYNNIVKGLGKAIRGFDEFASPESIIRGERKLSRDLTAFEEKTLFPEENIQRIYENSYDKNGMFIPEDFIPKLRKLKNSKVIDEAQYRSTLEKVKEIDTPGYKLLRESVDNENLIAEKLIDGDPAAIDITNQIYDRVKGNPVKMREFDTYLSKIPEILIRKAVEVGTAGKHNFIDIKKVQAGLDKLYNPRSKFFYRERMPFMNPSRESDPVSYIREVLDAKTDLAEKDLRALVYVSNLAKENKIDGSQMFELAKFPKNISEAVSFKQRLLSVPEGDKAFKNIENSLFSKYFFDDLLNADIAGIASNQDLLQRKNAMLAFMSEPKREVADKFFKVSEALLKASQETKGKGQTYQQAISNVGRVGKGFRTAGMEVSKAGETVGGVLALLKFLPETTIDWLSNSKNFDMFVKQWVKDMVRAGYLQTYEGQKK